MSNIKKYFSFELFFWIIALIFLAMIDPAQPHFSFCLFNRLGFSWCPGCGIGRSVAYLLHGAVAPSLKTHWLGTFALFMIVYRILQLIYFKTTKKQHYGKSILTF